MRRAAAKAVYEWANPPMSRDELIQQLWVWYLERPSRQRMLAELPQAEAVRVVKRTALQLLSKATLAANAFAGKDLYSSEAVKAALKGDAGNRYLASVLPVAFTELERRNVRYAEALRSRYERGQIPTPGPAAKTLTDAHRALTEEVNLLVLTTDHAKGPGSKAAVYPETRRVSGDTSDPTADLALALMGRPAERDEYLRGAGLGIPVKPVDGERKTQPPNIFDPAFNSGASMYRGWVFPDLASEPQPLLHNWSREDLSAYCGGEHAM